MENYRPEPTADDVLRFNNGDTLAFEKIAEALYNKVLNCTRKLLKDQYLAKDITQDTFLKLWSLKGNFITFSNIQAFVMITARNASLRFLQNRGNKVMLDVADGVEIAVDHEDFEEMEHKALRIMAEVETLDVLTQIIDELPADKREVLRLYYFDKLSKKEIAARYGISPTAAAKKINRAIILLRINLQRRNILLILTVIINLLKKVFN